jgi:alpha-L-fucosidase
MPMAQSWSFVPDDSYKSPRVLIHMLADVVAKGGNLLLNIGPGPDGRWHDAAYDRLEALGAWMRVNGEAIYGTRSISPFTEGKIRLTQGRDGEVYGIYLADEGETGLPRAISMGRLQPAPGATVTLLGSDAAIRWEAGDEGFVAWIPEGTPPPAEHAWVLRISEISGGFLTTSKP